jgi:competence protein ComEC
VNEEKVNHNTRADSARRILIIRKFRTLIVILLIFSITSFSYADRFIITNKTANIRSEPNKNSTLLQKAHKGDWFIYLGNSTDNKWRKVELSSGSKGWVYYTLGRAEDDNYLDNLTPTSDISSPGTGFDISKLEIHVIDVRPGDSTLIVAYGENNQKAAILLDAGKPGRGDKFVVPYMKSLGILELKYVIASHHDSDHAGGLDEVLLYDPNEPEDYDIKLTGKAFVAKGEVSQSQRKEYDEYVNSVKNQTGENVLILSPPSYLSLAKGITIQAVTGGGEYIDKETNNVVDLEVKDANAKSIGFLITYNMFKFFVAGDLGGQVKHKYIENKVAPYVGDIDVLRVSHHGSNTSTNKLFLSITKPEAAIISTGSDNNYGHPRKSVIDRLKQSNPNIKIYQTEEGDQSSQYKDLVSFEGKVSGNIVVSTSGECIYSITGSGLEFSDKEVFVNDDCL